MTRRRRGHLLRQLGAVVNAEVARVELELAELTSAGEKHTEQRLAVELEPDRRTPPSSRARATAASTRKNANVEGSHPGGGFQISGRILAARRTS